MASGHSKPPKKQKLRKSGTRTQRYEKRYDRALTAFNKP